MCIVLKGEIMQQYRYEELLSDLVEFEVVFVLKYLVRIFIDDNFIFFVMVVCYNCVYVEYVFIFCCFYY